MQERKFGMKTQARKGVVLKVRQVRTGDFRPKNAPDAREASWEFSRA